MMYGNYREDYGNYGRRRRDSRGRYMESGNYGRRYRGEDMMDEMRDHYMNYSEGREEMDRGNYGAGQDTMESYEYMLKSFKDFFKHLKNEANSQEEVEMLQKTAREIGQM